MEKARTVEEIKATIEDLANRFFEDEALKGYRAEMDELCEELTAHYLSPFYDHMAAGFICPDPGSAALLNLRKIQGLILSAARLLEITAKATEESILTDWALNRGINARTPIEFYDALHAFHGLALSLGLGEEEEYRTYGRIKRMVGETVQCFIPALSPFRLFDLTARSFGEVADAFSELDDFEILKPGRAFQIDIKIGGQYEGAALGTASIFAPSWLGGFGELAIALDPTRTTKPKLVFVRVIEVEGKGLRFLSPEIEKSKFIHLSEDDFPDGVEVGELYVVRAARFGKDHGWTLSPNGWVKAPIGIVRDCISILWERLKERRDAQRRGDELPTINVDEVIRDELARGAAV